MKKIFLLLLVLVTSSFVFSQEAEDGFDEDSIENVVTTALLKEETVQDASVAVTVAVAVIVAVAVAVVSSSGSSGSRW